MGTFLSSTCKLECDLDFYAVLSSLNNLRNSESSVSFVNSWLTAEN
uniref:Uncharacterized protein n=1 Tax=Arundo donax TaxID=35708 RepID=A0A0A9B7S7_ARUDO